MFLRFKIIHIWVADIIHFYSSEYSVKVVVKIFIVLKFGDSSKESNDIRVCVRDTQCSVDKRFAVVLTVVSMFPSTVSVMFFALGVCNFLDLLVFFFFFLQNEMSSVFLPAKQLGIPRLPHCIRTKNMGSYTFASVL